MQKLNNYILEKLKINKDTKIDTSKIDNKLGIIDKISNIFSSIKNTKSIYEDFGKEIQYFIKGWIMDNKIDEYDTDNIGFIGCGWQKKEYPNDTLKYFSLFTESYNKWNSFILYYKLDVKDTFSVNEMYSSTRSDDYIKLEINKSYPCPALSISSKDTFIIVTYEKHK